MSYEVLYITILYFVPQKNIIYGPSKDKFLAPPLAMAHYCYLINTTSPSWPLTRTDPTQTTIWPVSTNHWLRPSLILIFALTFDQKLKFLKWPILLSFFIWSSEIGQLANSSLWFLQRHSSWHLQVIFSCLFNLKPSSSFRLEFEGGC